MLLLFAGALAVFILYAGLIGWGWWRGRQEAAALNSDETPPISVVVAARNEANNLPDLLEALDEQTHPSHEVVIVDDASTDDTASIAESWAADRAHATLVRVTDPNPPRKKHALARGIDAATHDLLAFTDADCRPSPDWLSVLAAGHASTNEDCIIVGYSPLQGAGLLGYFARYETLIAGIYTVAALGWGRPFMAVGRNLSYPRSVFEAVDGFSSVDESMSGDDDLFVQTVHQQEAAPVRALLDPRSYVPTDAPTSWREWLRQRRRHVSAGRHYGWDVGVHLTLLHASIVVLWFAPFFLGKVGIGILATGLLARHSYLGPGADQFDETDLLAVFPLWELGYALYHLTVVPWGLLRPPEQW